MVFGAGAVGFEVTYDFGLVQAGRDIDIVGNLDGDGNIPAPDK